MGLLVDVLDLLMLNPQIRDFLTSLSLSAAKEVGARSGKWVVESLTARIKKAGLFRSEKVAEAEKKLNELTFSKQITGITMMQNFWIDFLEFMFPDRDVALEKLNEELCDYIAQRIYAGLGFEQLLIDIGYKPERIRYMTYFVGQRSKTPFYFDLKASFEQEYFDNLLIARVIDSRVSSPPEFVNSLPSVIQDINGDTASQAILRDHDIIAIIQSNPQSTAQLTKFRQTIRTVQTSNDVNLPRLIFFTTEELEHMLACTEGEDRANRFKQKLLEVRPYRGIE